MMTHYTACFQHHTSADANDSSVTGSSRDEDILEGITGTPPDAQLYKMPAEGSGPTSLNRYKELHFSGLFSRSTDKKAPRLYIRRDNMKLAVKFVLLFTAVAFAAELKEAERAKTYRRLIPADVLRGEYLD